MSNHYLPDPRQYPEPNVNNRLIFLAQRVLQHPHDQEGISRRQALQDAMVDLLARDEVLMISVALNMAPSQAVHRVLWQGLRAAVEDAAGQHAIVFAMPLVLVAGSKACASLPERIADVDGLNALLREHGVFSDGADVFLSGRLLHPDTIVGLSPAKLYCFTRQLVDVARGLPLELPGSAITVKEEGVFLRYLLGVAIQPEHAAPAVDFAADIRRWGRPMMSFLGEALKTGGVTLFPMARQPAPLMQAMVEGNQARLDVALQVFASALLRQLRSAGQTPLVRMSAHPSQEIHVTIGVAGSEKPAERFVWPLSPMDDVRAIQQSFLQLMHECQVDQVEIAEAIEA